MKKFYLLTIAFLVSLTFATAFFTDAGQTSKLDKWHANHPNVNFELPSKIRGTFYSFNKAKKSYYTVLNIQQRGTKYGRQNIGGPVSYGTMLSLDPYVIGNPKGNAFRIGFFHDYNVNVLNSKDEEILRLHKVKYNGKWVKAISVWKSTKKGTKAKLYFASKIQKPRVTTNAKYELKWTDTKEK